jgi:hypothetical protein
MMTNNGRRKGQRKEINEKSQKMRIENKGECDKE